MLATIEDVKRKLELPVTDTDRDEALNLVLESASARILGKTRHLEADATGRVEHFRDVAGGDEVRLAVRPVTALTSVEGRTLATAGEATWEALDADLVDANEGVVVLLGDAGWPLLRVTFNTDGVGSGLTAPAMLRDATAGLAAYWFRLHVAGPATDVAVGSIRQRLETAGEPPWLNLVLAGYLNDDPEDSGATGGALLC